MFPNMLDFFQTVLSFPFRSLFLFTPLPVYKAASVDDAVSPSMISICSNSFFHFLRSTSVARLPNVAFHACYQHQLFCASVRFLFTSERSGRRSGSTVVHVFQVHWKDRPRISIIRSIVSFACIENWRASKSCFLFSLFESRHDQGHDLLPFSAHDDVHISRSYAYFKYNDKGKKTVIFFWPSNIVRTTNFDLCIWPHFSFYFALLLPLRALNLFLPFYSKQTFSHG